MMELEDDIEKGIGSWLEGRLGILMVGNDGLVWKWSFVRWVEWEWLRGG